MQTARGALNDALAALNLEWPEKGVIEYPKDARHGDLATNVAMVLCKAAGMKPYDLAGKICGLLENRTDFSCEIAKPGFINITFTDDYWRSCVVQMAEAGDGFGRLALGGARKVLVEYVSANPTGPLHIGHGRGAAVGDSVTRILRFAGYSATPEYYVNDAGRQMRLLGYSVWLRARELKGLPVDWPEEYYRGDYIRDLAAELLAKDPELLGREDAENRCFEYAVAMILAGIKNDLAEFGASHEIWFSEKSLVDGGKVDAFFDDFRQKGLVYEKDGALWFKVSEFEDEKDRVLKKSDGYLTYFASDIAYHANKLERGFDEMIDVWGADHHGYIPRMNAAIRAMGRDPGDAFHVILIQLVNLLRDGHPVAMSTRAGEFVTLKEVVDEVGVDAARFMFLSRKSDQPLDFDLELVKRRNLDNPVYYVQYAYARICALMRRASHEGIETVTNLKAEDLAGLTDEEFVLAKSAWRFEDAVAEAAANRAPHAISFYLMDLAGKLHHYYANVPVLAGGETQARARLALVNCVAAIFRNGLNLLGVSAPDTM